jgi:hypothetical protein
VAAEARIEAARRVEAAICALDDAIDSYDSAGQLLAATLAPHERGEALAVEMGRQRIAAWVRCCGNEVLWCLTA